MKKIIRWIIKNSKVDGINLLIYIIGLIISVSLIALSFIFSSENNWRAIFGGTGASGIGAVLLGYFIERANNCRLEKEKLRTREKLVSAIDSDIVQIMCHEVLLLEKEQNEFFCSTKGKTLYDIIEDVEKIYNEQIISNALRIKDTEIFNENHK